MEKDFTDLSRNETDVKDAPEPVSVKSLRDLALLAGPERQALLQSHPLHADIIEIKTPPVKAALMAIQEHIKFRRPGLAFAADCRHGKTTMVTMVSKAMGQMFPSVPYQVISANRHDKVTEKAVWTDVLLGFGIKAAGTAIDRKKAARGSVLSACREANGDSFALYIDEGQNWSDLEFNFLRDFTNELRQYFQKTIITVTVGDDKLRTVAEAIRVSDKGLWSRFLRKLRDFSGISSLKELRLVMDEYDSIAGCEYPKGSGVCYSEFFVRHAFAGGWRLAHEAERLWGELEAVAALHGKLLRDVGMQWIAESILAFLTLQLDRDTPGFKPSQDDWVVAVESSQFETTFL